MKVSKKIIGLTKLTLGLVFTSQAVLRLRALLALPAVALLTLSFLAIPLLAVSGGGAMASESVSSIRYGVTSQRTRIVLELSEKLDYNLFTLDAPHRVVLDLPAVTWPEQKPDDPSNGLIKNVRYGLFGPGKSRLVVDATGPVEVQKIFMLGPSAGFPYRLVIDLVETTQASFLARIAKRKASTPNKGVANAVPQVPFTPKPKTKKAKRVIVIDAGHGGVDPGAHGRKAQEKNIVLAFAKALASTLKRTGKYEVHLTRDRDIYIPLRKRVNIARQYDADLFVSIHADSISRSAVRGMSIYTLSETASDKEAAALARKENRSDIIAGIDFGDQPAEVANILIDLAQRETKNLSVKFAGIVVNEMKGKTRLLDRPHRFAGFRVLKAPDVPSVLIELGFLTNKYDERELSSSKWRNKVAEALSQAINQYFLTAALDN